MTASAAAGATGATGLERLLRIFLMKLQQNTESNEQHFLQQRLTQRSIGQTCAKLLQETPKHKTSTETYNSTRNHRYFHEKPNEPKNSNLAEQNSCKPQRTLLHRTRAQTNGGKHEITEQNSKEQ